MAGGDLDALHLPRATGDDTLGESPTDVGDDDVGGGIGHGSPVEGGAVGPRIGWGERVRALQHNDACGEECTTGDRCEETQRTEPAPCGGGPDNRLSLMASGLFRGLAPSRVTPAADGISGLIMAFESERSGCVDAPAG